MRGGAGPTGGVFVQGGLIAAESAGNGEIACAASGLTPCVT
jgi:hypothetical protein